MQATAAILAGGASKRMGSPKALCELAGRPLISYPLAAAREAGVETTVVAKPDSPLPPLDCPVLREPPEPRHPLCGIVAALGASGGRPLVVVGCDMPFVPPALLAWLAGLDELAVAVEAAGRLQPLLARYDPLVTPPLADALDRGAPLRQAVAALGPRLVGARELARFGDPERIAFNVNSPSDLALAEEML